MRAVWLLAIVLALSACSTAPLPEVIVADGAWRHPITGFEFPEKVGNFRRHRIDRFDREAINVAASYRSIGSSPILATVYHYPATVDGSIPSDVAVASHFEEQKHFITLATPQARFVEEHDVEQEINGVKLRGRLATYRFEPVAWLGEPGDSHLYLFAVGNWYVKFRFTHGDFMKEAAPDLERDFVESFRWEKPAVALYVVLFELSHDADGRVTAALPMEVHPAGSDEIVELEPSPEFLAAVLRRVQSMRVQEHARGKSYTFFYYDPDEPANPIHGDEEIEAWRARHLRRGAGPH